VPSEGIDGPVGLGVTLAGAEGAAGAGTIGAAGTVADGLVVLLSGPENVGVGAPPDVEPDAEPAPQDEQPDDAAGPSPPLPHDAHPPPPQDDPQGEPQDEPQGAQLLAHGPQLTAGRHGLE
jgi:hypothetical protein